jgi:hypothetical protein
MPIMPIMPKVTTCAIAVTIGLDRGWPDRSNLRPVWRATIIPGKKISHRAESDNQGKEKHGVSLAMPKEVEKAKPAMA